MKKKIPFILSIIIFTFLTFLPYTYSEINTEKISSKPLENEIIHLNNKIKNLEKEIEDFQSKINLYIKLAENFSNSAKGYLENVKFFSYVLFTIVIGIIVGGIIGILKRESIKNWIAKATLEQAKKEASLRLEETKIQMEKTLNETRSKMDKEFAFLSAYFYTQEGYTYYSRNLEFAISLTEKAYELVSEYFIENLESSTEKVKDLVGTTIGNLIYYKVEAGDIEDYKFLIKNAKIVKEIGKNLRSPQLIDDYIFVMVKLKNKLTKEEIKEAFNVLQNYEDILISEDIRSHEEIKKFKEILLQENKEKRQGII